MTTAMAIHPFEKSGLGTAPFRYIGMIHQEISYGEAIGHINGVEVQTKPGGTCDHCGHYIRDMFRVESSDGQRFKVGCDCIMKVDMVLGRAINQDVKAAKRQRELGRIKAATAALPTAHSLRSEPHPTAWMAQQGATLWHYCEWMLWHAGQSGKLRAARLVEASIATRLMRTNNDGRITPPTTRPRSAIRLARNLPDRPLGQAIPRATASRARVPRGLRRQDNGAKTTFLPALTSRLYDWSYRW